MSPHPSSQKRPAFSGRGITAVLGPTNTGKTHLAIERMAGHESGLIGLPLRLLAREVYQRIGEKVGFANAALITGEEKISPPGARYLVCTVEAMPQETDAAFVAIDEVQIAADLERGHVFTDRIMNLRGREETMLLGAATVEPVLRELLPGIDVITRPRMSVLDYAGSKKITRLPPRSAIVAFSADEVYVIAELIRRQRGGAAVVLGSLSPRTRNAQVALYESGDVDFLVATDAIGMGLNLDLNHVAFAQDRKFDGLAYRRLTPAEMGQIAGRAGRHMRNGTFGITGQVQPFEDELVMRLESHTFDQARVLVWRNRDLDFTSVDALKDSLDMPSKNRLLLKGLPGTDAVALDTLSRDAEITGRVKDEDGVRLLWEVCQTPDYRKISPGAHADLLREVFLQIADNGQIDEDWLNAQTKRADRTDGDIDALSARIAQIRTWTYLSHRAEWLQKAAYWQEKTRDLEDRLSDALHESLTKRFIDRRTSVLMKRLRENTHMEAEIDGNGDVQVEGHHVGRLAGFRFTPDARGETPEAKAANAAAMKALAAEIDRRAKRLAACPNADIALASDGLLRWLGEPVARLVSGESSLKPRAVLLADEQLTGASRDMVAGRLDRWIANHIANLLKPLVEMSGDQTLEGLARGVAFRLVESLGNIDRREIAADVSALDQDMRASLRRHGVRFGAYNIFVPALLKPAPAELLCLLWGIANDSTDAPGLTDVPAILATGRTSIAFEPSFEREAWRLCGYRILGRKAVRIDILERLADLIRPALFWKPADETPKPDGAIDGRSFYVTPAMMSILGATHEDMELILKGLGYRYETRHEADIKPAAETAEPDKADVEVKEEAGATVDETERPEQISDMPAVAGASATDTKETLTASGESAATDTSASGREISDKSAEPAQADDSADGKATSAEVDADAPEGPKTILVWRQARTGGRRQTGNKRHQAGAKAGKATHKGKRGQQGHDKKRRNAARSGPAKPSKAGKQPDPDSPFAKLAALKESLKTGD